MAEKHDPNQLVGTAADVAPLAWVIDEIRTSLTDAVNGIKGFLANKDDLESLRNARSQVHQATGALQLLDLRGVAQITEAVEQSLRRFELEPKECLPTAVRPIESALSAVVAYLEGLLSGRPNQPIRLFPYLRDVLVLNKAGRVHPADLIFPDLSRRPAFHTIEARQFSSEQLRDRRAQFEHGLLGFLRNPDDARARTKMRVALAELEHMPQRGLARSFWWITRGLLEALEANKIAVDVDLKRVLARLNLQLRRMIEGGGAVAERLMVDTLYYVGRADVSLPRVAEVKRLYGLDALIPADFERSTLTALDSDALRNLKEALVQAKTLWSQIVGGAGDPAKFEQELKLAHETAGKLAATPVASVLQALSAVTRKFSIQASSVREVLGLEAASALLFVDIGVDQLPQLEEQYAERSQAVIERLTRARKGKELPAAGPWMTELARRAQDRLTMGTVVDETQGTLREVEQRLDRFFRNPSQRGELAATSAMFDQVCGVFSVLGFEEPAAALRNVQESIQKFVDPAVPADPAEFARIAQNLGALGFFVESLGQDGDAQQGMFRYDPNTGVFSADLGQVQAEAPPSAPEDEYVALPRTADSRVADAKRTDNVETAARKTLQAAHRHAVRLTDSVGDAHAMEELARLVPLLLNEADLLDDQALKVTAERATVVLDRLKETHDRATARELAVLLTHEAADATLPPATPLPESQAAVDIELHGIFIEEAREVLDNIVDRLAELQVERNSPANLTTVRRAFHTLKGSSRMVGLRQFGEGAWSVEQCFNLWLAQERPADDDLLALADTAQQVMRGWVDQIERNPSAVVDPSALVYAAQRVREGGAFEYAELPPQPAPPAAARTAPPAASAPVMHDEQAEAAAIAALAGQAPDFNLDDLDAPAQVLDAPATIELTMAGSPLEFDEELSFDDAPVAAFSLDDLESAVIVEESSLADESMSALPQDMPGDPALSLSEDMRQVGPLQISHGLYSVFLNEADECIRVLGQDVAEWRYEPTRPVSPHAVRCAHSLAGISATVGLAPVFAIADPLNDLMHELSVLAQSRPFTLTPPQFDTLQRVSERLRGMLHQFSAGFYPDESPLEVNAVHELLNVVRIHSLHHEIAPAEFDDDTDADPEDEQSPPLAELDGLEFTEPESIDESAPDSTVEEIEAQEVEPEPGVELVDTWREPQLPAEPAVAAPKQAVAAAVAPLDFPTEELSGQDADGQLASDALRDELDAELLQVFLTEASELLPAVAGNLRGLLAAPDDRDLARELMRRLHTIKGSARMAGAMRLGELVHDMETRIETAMQLTNVPAAIIEDLQGEYDQAMSLYDELHNPDLPLQSASSSLAPVIDLASARAEAQNQANENTAAAESNSGPLAPIELKPANDAETFTLPVAPVAAVNPGSTSFIRVRSDVLDKLVDQAGEVSISRSKLENEVTTIKGSLVDLTENIQRLRGQLREVEIQADAQISARGDQLSRESADFDPLEFDRYSRLQELTRLLAESVEDVAMVQSNMLKGLQMADVDLTSQNRLTRDLQQQLMRVRLVPFASVSERLYRVARQTAKELGKRVNLEMRGATTEIDRGVLERMAGPFEHLVRNAIVHGLEMPEQRRAGSKTESGELSLDVRQEGNEIIVVFADDGAGLQLDRIRARAIEKQLVGPDQELGDRELMEMIFMPGFSTADEITELAGRGVGMDVVRSELSQFGGRIAVSSEPGRGTRFTLYLPMSLAITQVVLVTLQGRRYAIPSAMVEQVRRYRPMVLMAALGEGMLEIPPIGPVVLRPLAQLLGEETNPHLPKQTPVILLRSGDDRLAICVDDVTSSREVVVKNVGAHVSRLAGILGATILGNGEIVLIINPVQLIARAPEPPAVFETAPGAREEAMSEQQARLAISDPSSQVLPVVMVVDDSLTVRRVTQRLLERSGYQVALAKDGVDALRQLQDIKPEVMLVDIEMPRMDGYDLTRNVRSNPETADIPIIMITSRTAEKHRSMAFELGVNEYLGKPYQEEELVALIQKYQQQKVTTS